MGHRDDERAGTHPVPREPGRKARTHPWARELRTSVGCSVALLALLLLIDWGTGSLTWWRGVLWFTLSVLLFVVLCPPRVRAGRGWIASRSLLRSRLVRTDLLVSVRAVDGVCRRLVLLDSLGGRVELDPEVLVDHPDVWYRLDEDARHCVAAGRLQCGTDELRDISEQVDRETALAVFRVSGLES
ncbi:hypothetical protein ACFC08_30245 [Streptomyces sp. NPDC056112]|uniref:hypothetical protein n=1 Tax=unclassified Streptomyces TaxID=2593676 RepID=UPI001CD68AFC|nr:MULTISPECIES: hypothetical protein [unclassified Streptomyces]